MSEKKILFYMNIGSQPVRAVKALLDIGKIDYQQIPIDLLKGETRTPEYLKINPFGQIPFIKTEEGFGIGESNAILQYLCQKYQHKVGSYYGQDLISKTKVNIALSWYQSSFRPASMARIKLKVYGTIKKGIPHTEAQIKQADLNLGDAIKQLERILKQSKYVAGQIISIADLLVYFEITNLIYYQMQEILKEFEKVEAWYRAMQSIPEIKKIQEKWLETVPLFKKILASAEAIKG